MAEQRARHPLNAVSKLIEAREILYGLGMPRAQSNERSAFTLLALLDLKPETPWSQASNPLMGVTQLMDYMAEHYGKKYAPNSRETVRRFTLHQFLQAGLVDLNPDDPKRPTNSPDNVYQVRLEVLDLLRTYGTAEWQTRLSAYLAQSGTLREKYAQARMMRQIPVTTASGEVLTLSAGGQSELLKEVLEQFCSRFTPNGVVLYVGDTGAKWKKFEEEALATLGVRVDAHGKMPDVVVHHREKGWLVLIEVVTSHGPVDPKRHAELKELFKGSKAGLVFVTAFETRKAAAKYLTEISWETELWAADSPDHIIHFNGERFLGPYPETVAS